jgi:hypothetical protein
MIKDNNYQQESVEGAICPTCAREMTNISNLEFPNDPRLQFLFCQLVLATLIKTVRDTIEIPKWLKTPELRTYFIIIELQRITYYRKFICSEYYRIKNLPEPLDKSLFNNVIAWVRDWDCCPYDIKELPQENGESSFVISTIGKIHENTALEALIPSNRILH